MLLLCIPYILLNLSGNQDSKLLFFKDITKNFVFFFSHKDSPKKTKSPEKCVKIMELQSIISKCYSGKNAVE